MSKQSNGMLDAAKQAWTAWHESVGFADDDDYIPEMPPLWRIAFEHGAKWATESKEAVA